MSKRTELLQYLADIERKLSSIYGSTYRAVLELADVRRAIEAGVNFTWEGNPAAEKKLTQLLNDLSSKATLLIGNGVQQGYKRGEEDGTLAVVDRLGRGKSQKEAVKEICQQATKERRQQGVTAHAYATGERGGLTLSSRVWNLTGNAKKELEIIIQNGILEGKGASEIASGIKGYLYNPNALFRSVRNKETGNFQLSEAARKYHPGQGVYRSAYKNALRLVRTEMTNAYRRAEWESYQNNPLVTNYEIRLSNNHTTTTTSGKVKRLVDICDKLAGVYPKTFRWEGWHPNCRCTMVPIVVTPKDFGEYLKARRKARQLEWKPEQKASQPKTTLPAKFTKWINDNSRRIKAAPAKPAFIEDNKGIIQLEQAQQKSKFQAAATIEDVIARIKAAGIGNVELGEATINEANVVLEVIEDMAATLKGLDISKFTLDFTKQVSFKGHKADIGGSYMAGDKKEMIINLKSFQDSIYKPAVAWEERIQNAEKSIARFRKDIEEYKAHLEKKLSTKMARDIKGYIKNLEDAIWQKENDIRTFQKAIEQGARPRTFTIAAEYEDITSQVKAEIYHEFGHYLQRTKLNNISYRSKGMIAPSDYGTVSDGELFAEWFCYYKMKGAKGVPSELLSIFERECPNSSSAKPLKVYSGTLQQFAAEILKTGRSIGKVSQVGRIDDAIRADMATRSIALQTETIIVLDKTITKYIDHPKAAKGAQVPIESYGLIEQALKNPLHIYEDTKSKELVYVYTNPYEEDKLIKVVIQPNYKYKGVTANVAKSWGVVEERSVTKSDHYRIIK